MERFFGAIGGFSVRYKYIVAVAWIVFTIFAVAVFPPLSSVTKDQNSGFLPSDSPSMQAANLAAAFQNQNYIESEIVASRANGPLTAADLATVDHLAATVKGLPHVKVVRDDGISKDGQARQLQLQADVSFSGTGTAKTLVDDIRADFTTIGAPSGLELHLTGQLATAVDTQTSNNKSQGSTQGLSFLFIIVLLLIAFRALLAPLITLLPAALVLALSGPVIAASTRLGVQASSITQIILIVLVLGAGTDYGLFLVFRVREELRRGRTPADAVIHAVTVVGETISFSAFTVIVAMLCLLLAKFGLYQGLGPALAIGIGLMLLAALTFLPAILAIFGRAVFWPTKVVDIGGERPGVWGRVGRASAKRPKTTLVIGLAFFVALALGQLGSGTTGFADQSSGPAGSDSAAGNAVLQKHFPGTGADPTLVLFHFPQSVWANPASLNSVQQSITHNSTFLAAIGPLTPNGYKFTGAQLLQIRKQLGNRDPGTLPRIEPPTFHVPAAEYNAYRSTAQFISPGGATVQWTAVLRYGNSNSAHDVDQIPALRTTIAQIGAKAGATATGAYGLLAFAYDVNHISTDDLTLIIPVVAVLIAILLGMVLRSMVAPVYLVASVVLSYLAALGFAAIVFVHLGGDSGLNFVLPFLMFVFLTALGSDYNILVMTRIREEAKKLPLREAVPHAIGVSGTTVTTAGVILAGTFAVLAVAGGSGSGAEQIRQIGYGIAAGVIMDTFLIRTLLVPSIAVLLGRWNWFPSKMSRHSSDHPEFDQETFQARNAS
jgi:RND superfamily putative drug exporter